MKTDLYYFGNFRHIIKKSEENIELDAGLSIRREKPVLNFGAKLKDGDQIYLFIMLAGG